MENSGSGAEGTKVGVGGSAKEWEKEVQPTAGRFEISPWEGTRGGLQLKRGRARAPGSKRRLPCRRSFYLGCPFIRVGSGRADGNYRETSSDRSPPSAATAPHGARSSHARVADDRTGSISLTTWYSLWQRA